MIIVHETFPLRVKRGKSKEKCFGHNKEKPGEEGFSRKKERPNESFIFEWIQSKRKNYLVQKYVCGGDKFRSKKQLRSKSVAESN